MSADYAGEPLQPYEQLERNLAEWIGIPHVVACASGTAALHLSWEAMQLPLGSEVLCPDLTMYACPRSISLAGLTPVFVDCDERLLMDLDRADETLAARAGRIKGILAVHIYGRRIDMDALAELADKYRCVLVEDMAEAHGVPVHPRTDAACYSFYANKIVTSHEEGGCVAFRDPKRAGLTRQLRNLGFTPEHNFVHLPRAVNARLANSLARPILASLAAVECSLQRRREIEGWYDRLCPDEWRMPPRDVVWVTDLRIPGMSGELQDRLVRALNSSGIAARHCFKRCSTQLEYLGSWTSRGEVATRMSREVIYLPCTPGVVTQEYASKAFAVISDIVGRGPP